MQNVTAILSMLHEPVSPSSATRTFRGEAVLSWTLQRLCLTRQLGSLAVLCWEDQVQDVAPIAADHNAHVLAKDPRVAIASIEAIAASRRWADGWRGGLLGTCDFDLGFHGPWVQEIVQKLQSDAVVLVDPSAGLVDPAIIDSIIEHAQRRDGIELCFTQAAPGLAGALLRPSLIERLAATQLHPGRLLHYLPDQPMRDPISGDGCVAVPTPVARTTHSFRLDSDRQIRRIADAFVNLNGQLIASDAEELLHRLRCTADVGVMPREIVLEIGSRRASAPIFRPGRTHGSDRGPISCQLADSIFRQVGATDGIRLSISGVGDPLLHESVFELIALAQQRGVGAIHLETDLLPADDCAVEQLADSRIDVVSVHLPAMTPATYAAVMGADRFTQVMQNIQRFVVRRHANRRGVPLIAPVFTKCRLNLGEMESWYDQWLKALGAAVIVGPSDFCGLIDDVGVADMSPPRRRPCSRLWSRMTILSDGRVVSCEQDVLGRQVIGDASVTPISEIWREQFKPLRAAHSGGECGSLPLCSRCREWHRP